MNIVEGLKWRYATKRFDSNKKLTKDQLEYLKDAVNYIPSSFGLQPYKVFVIENPEIRAKLQEAAWGQPQLTEASQIFLFANFTQYGPDKVEQFLKLGAEINNYPLENSAGYRDLLNGTISSLTPEQLSNWNAKQAYIALGALVSAAAEQQIDICPMEGFDKAKFDEILGLKEQGLTSVCIGAVGSRSPEDKNQFLKKVRKPKSELFETI
ncbi:MAG: NAD(P)H-dependent oxidoreductase [Bacteroidetes bacterium HGW-Bacteroidetes-10]|nr:MAG: NAD(P)H-dependent oxidoreductase [Bacteroidetes bacterium HGW-Bacteroidetes-10]